MEGRTVLKPIYFFDDADGRNKDLLGSKGAGLVEMRRLGLPVPPGFIITTEICAKFYEAGKRLPDGLMDEVRQSIRRLESLTDKKFGDALNPLLVSVRSGAPVSMPGMLDTILNLGLNDAAVRGLAKQSNDPKFAWDVYRRFIHMFGKTVYNIEDKFFEEISAARDIHTEEDLKEIALSFKLLCEHRTGNKFPMDAYKQLELAIDAVFRSWMGRRAVEYRRQYNITPETANGTAVIIVAMVFGNMGHQSATGVVFTRDPERGEKRLYGEYLVNAQGEDVVSGKTIPKHIDSLSSELPEVDKQLRAAAQKLEDHFREPQDVEFTAERGKLYILQTRNAKMNAIASVKTSVDMFYEGLIDKIKALSRVDPEGLEQVLYPRIDYSTKHRPIATGVGASPGAASGIAIFNVDKAESLGRKGKKVILVREDTKPEDVPAFFQSVGILTSRGGRTSHAAVVARGMGKPCVVGCSQIEIDEEKGVFNVDKKYYVKEGQKITIDGSSGRVFPDEIPSVKPEITSEFKELLEWAKEMKKIQIRANADVPESAALARKYGAEGVGLCRTERMFNQHDRITQFVKMIMAESEDKRRQALADLEPLQRSDFKTILNEMKGLPVTIRLLDPPLHEFLPKEEDLIHQLFELKSKTIQDKSEILEIEKVLKRVHELSEINPMLGHRGVRMGLSFPEIYETQIRAICEATAELSKEDIHVEPQIMVPQVGMLEELIKVRNIFESTKRDVEHKHKIKLKIKFGTMIEVVRSCLIADDIAKIVDFISFGTNDLTQATFSFSREDSESKFLPFYLEKGIITINPFQSIDIGGVGRLMKIAIDLAKSVKRNIEIGICGEHGGDPRSIEFCNNIGLDYVSASSHRIPLAILAAAQSAIKKQ
ncbi:MAG TPA: pyruvate, phosphate dikinase [Nitrososphaeraceae archaeon]|nr:pyruvate, phosphate dikinase [Nitrososphaeraceae archaeon]